jgi:hypothetical protein
MEKHLCPKRPKKDLFDRSGVYKLKCRNCPGSYIGQTGQSFTVRYGEHMQAIRINSEKADYSHHNLNTGHSYGSLENLEILNIQEKGPYLNTLESFIFTEQNKQVSYLMTPTLTPITQYLNF